MIKLLVSEFRKTADWERDDFCRRAMSRPIKREHPAFRLGNAWSRGAFPCCHDNGETSSPLVVPSLFSSVHPLWALLLSLYVSWSWFYLGGGGGGWTTSSCLHSRQRVTVSLRTGCCIFIPALQIALYSTLTKIAGDTSFKRWGVYILLLTKGTKTKKREESEAEGRWRKHFNVYKFELLISFEELESNVINTMQTLTTFKCSGFSQINPHDWILESILKWTSCE